MPFVEMLRPITDKIEVLENASVEAAGLSTAAYEYTKLKAKKQKRINIFLFFWPLIVLAVAYYWFM